MRRTEKGMEVSPNHSPTDNRTKNKDKSPISERSASEVADSSSASTTTPTTPTTKDAGSKRRTREFLLQSQAAMLVPEEEDPDKDYNSNNNHRRIRLQQPQQHEERSGAEDLLLGESGGCSPRSPPLPLRNPLITRSKSPRNLEDESGDSFDLQVETEDEDGMGDEDADESTDSSDLGNSGSSMPVSPSVSSNFMAMSTENLVGYSRYWRRKRLEEVCWKDAVEQTCNLGQASFPPDTEMNFLNRLLGKVLHPQKPNWLSEFLKYMLVTPLTNITPMSLYYQLYLNEIFHTNFISRGIHFLMMPCVTWTYLLIAAHWEVQILNDPPPRPAYHIDGKPVDLFAINGAFFLSLLFLIWWIVWGFVTKTYGFGFFMIPNLLVLYNTANIFHYWTKYDDSIATWWAPSPWYVNPWLLGIVFATIQALSHLAEPLPPRMNLTDRWVPKLEFLKEHWPNNKVYVIMVWLPQFIFGPINEFLAGPRLLPLLILKQMHMLGYRRDQWKHLVRLTKWARRYENPALDYIGTGGGLPMAKAEHVPPESYSAAKSELRMLKGRTNEKDVDRRMFLKMLLAKAQLNLWAYGPFASSSSSSSPCCDDEGRGGEEAKKKEGTGVKMSASYLEHCKQSDWEYDFKACIRLVRRDVIKIERVRQRILDDQRRKALQLVEAEKVSTPSLGSSTSTMPLASSSTRMPSKLVAKVTDSPALGSSPSLVRRGRDFLQRSFSLS